MMSVRKHISVLPRKVFYEEKTPYYKLMSIYAHPYFIILHYPRYSLIPLIV